MTIKTAKLLVAALKCTLTKRDSEFRVNFLGATEGTAYFTNDLHDAVCTAVEMHRRHCAFAAMAAKPTSKPSTRIIAWVDVAQDQIPPSGRAKVDVHLVGGGTVQADIVETCPVELARLQSQRTGRILHLTVGTRDDNRNLVSLWDDAASRQRGLDDGDRCVDLVLTAVQTQQLFGN